MRVLLVFLLVAARVQADPASSDPGRAFAENMNQSVEILLGQLEGQIAAGIHESPDEVPSREVPGPDGWKALLYAHDTADATRWPVLVFGPDGALHSAYHFLEGLGIQKAEWSRDGAYLAVLTRNQRADEPPGELVVIVRDQRIAKTIENGVVEFSMSPEGRDLIYVRVRDLDRPLGERALIQMDGMTGEKHLLTTLDFPRVQVRSFGSWEAFRRLPVTLVDYTGGILNPSERTGWVDGATASFTFR